MDASDPASVVAPGTTTEPVPSSTAPVEKKSLIQKILEAIMAIFGRK
jgi:hypothetical protein